MKTATASSAPGIASQTRAIAEEAARQAGLSLGDWLNSVVKQQAAEKGVPAGDWNEDERFKALGERLVRLSRSGKREGGDAGEAPARPSPSATTSAPDLDALAAPARPVSAGSPADAANATVLRERINARPLVEALRGQIAALSTRLERIRAVNDEPPPSTADAESLREGVASMARSVTDLAPRNAAIALQGAVNDLGHRLDAARNAGAGDVVVAPVESMLHEVLATLRKHDPHLAVERLERELRDLGEKVEALLSAAVDPRTLERIRKQTEEVRDLLAAAATRPFPFQRLEKQIGDLADRVERLATSPSPQAETERAVRLLSQARSQIERSIPASLLGAIARRLDQLAARVEDALQGPAAAATIDLSPLEERVRRIEAARISNERSEDFRLDAAPSETSARDCDRQRDPPASAPDPAGMAPALRYPIERPQAPDVRPLSSRAGETSARLEGATATQGDSPAFAKALRDLTNRLEELFRRRQPTANLDPQPFEHLANRVEGVLSEIDAKLDRQARTSDETRLLAQYVKELAARFGNPPRPEGEADHIERTLIRVDAALKAIDPRPLELAVNGLNERLDSAAKSPHAMRIVEQAADLLDKRLGSTNHARDAAAAIERAIDDMRQELETMRQVLPSSAAAPTATDALERNIADLRLEHRNSDRRTTEGLSEVQATLEKILRYLERREDKAARVNDGVSAREGVRVDFARSSDAVRTLAAEGGDDARLRDIPDRAPVGAISGFAGLPERNRGVVASTFLLEPGASAPTLIGGDDAEAAEPAQTSALRAHIAAARRAAQTALVESASKKIQRVSAEAPSSGGSPTPLSIARRTRAFFPGRRRPMLLALALLLASATTAVVYELRGGWPQAWPRSQVSAPNRVPDAAPPVREGSRAVKPSGTVDYSPVGDVAPAKAKNSPRPSAPPPPADLIAAIPAGLAQTLREEAAAGDPGAETELAFRYLDGRTLTRDSAIAAKWLELAAAQGLPIAQYRLATLYEKGNGVSRDTALARTWYLKAASAGNSRAMHNLAVLIAEDPRDGKPDYSEAAHWFRQAGELGVRDSQFNLGVLYGRGLGVPQDLGQSWLWFSLAAGQGDVDAAAKRDEVAAKLDANAQAAASKALAEFKTQAPSPEANELPSPAGGWQSRTGEPPSSPSASPIPRGPGARDASG